MNVITPISRKFYSQHKNGATFASDLTNFTTYYQINNIEKSKLIEVVEVSTISSADVTNQFTATVSGSNVTMLHPFNTWSDEGFVVGNTIRVEANGNSTTGTITIINGQSMTFTDASFIANLGVVSGDSRADYVIKATTIPTSLIWKYGIIPNSQTTPSYLSPIDGSEQAYAANGISGSLTTLNPLFPPRADFGSIQAKYDGASGTGNYIFTFTIEHIFQNPFFIDQWLTNYANGSVPTSFQGSNSYKYVAEMTFGVNINNTNDGKTFEDAYQTGSAGFIGQNFNAGAVNYTLVSTAYAVGATTVNSIDADSTTAVTIQLQKTNGNWTAGEQVYLYHTKLPTEPEYNGQTLVGLVTPWDDSFIFASLSNTEGAAPAASGILTNFAIAINGGDPTLLDIGFRVTYGAAELAKINNGDEFFIGLGVEDGSLSSTLSDRVIVSAAQSQWIKSNDITGLITANQIDFINSTEVLGVATPVSNAATWVNTVYQLSGDFRITKEANSNSGLLTSLQIREVAHNTTTGAIATIQSFDMPLGNFKAGPPTIDVGGTGYQPINYNSNRPLGNIPSSDNLRKVQINSIIPASYQNYQEFSWQLGWVFGWRQWVANQDIANNAPIFYDSTQENNNFNERSSNYSGVNGFDIYIFATAVINYNGALTVYNMMSDICELSDFDVDANGNTWTATTKYYDEAGIETNNIFIGQDIRIEIQMEHFGSSIKLSDAGAEIVVEVSGSNGEHSRLHSTKTWDTPTNLLKPLAGETNVKVTQIVGTPETIVLECLMKKELINDDFQYNTYGHLNTK